MTLPANDPREVRALLEHRTFLLALARRLVEDEHHAEDIVQEAWVRALDRSPTAAGAARRWLATVVRNLASTARGRERERPWRERAAAHGESNGLDPETTEAELEIQRMVVEELARLREPYRTTVHLRYVHDLSPAEIARRTRTPVKTVKTRLLRGLALLRASVERREPGYRSTWAAVLALRHPPGAGAPSPFARTLRSPAAGPAAAGAAPALVAGLAVALVAVGLARLLPDAAAEASAHADVAAPALRAGARARGQAPDRLLAGDPRTSSTRAAAAAHAAPGGVTGRVVDADGAPVAGASVAWRAAPVALRVVPGTEAWARRGADDAGGQVGGTTDADGRFALPRAAGRGELVVRAPGHPAVERQVVVPPPRADAPSAPHALDPIVLGPGLALAGRVEDERGAPVAGVQVKAFAGGEPAEGPWPAPTAVARTDAAGGFRLDGLPLGEWRLEVDEDAWMRAVLEGAAWTPGRAPGELVVTLSAGATIAGRVLRADGAVEPLVVRARRLADDPFQAMWVVDRRAPVAADGTFRFGGLAPDAYYALQLGAEVEGGDGVQGSGAARASRRADEVVARAGDVDVVLAARAPATLSFVAVDAVTGLPVTALAVELGPRRGPRADAHEHPAGAVALACDPGRYDLRVASPGYAPLEREDVAVTACGAGALGTLALEPLRSAEVAVTDGAGRPVAGALVAAVPVAGRRAWQAPRPTGAALTGADGTAVVATPSDAAYRVLVLDERHAPWASAVVAPQADGEAPRARAPRFHAELHAGGAVAVQVVDDRGRPVPRARVVHEPPAEVAAAWRDAGGRDRLAWTADDAGRVLLDALPAGEHRIALQPDDWRATPEWRTVHVAAGARVETTLRRTGRAHLGGTVTADGAPVPDARVLLELRDAAWPGPLRWTHTDAAGRYRFDDLEPDDYAVVIVHPARALPCRRAVALPPGESALLHELPTGRLSGRVVDAEGAPIAGARVAALRAGAADEAGAVERALDWYAVPTDVDGRFALRGLDPEAAHDLVARAPGFVTRRAAAPAAAAARGSGAPLEVELARGRGVTLAITGADGAPAAGALVRLHHVGAAGPVDPTVEARAGVDGRVAFTGLADGPWEAEVRPAGEAWRWGQEARERVPVELGGVRSIQLAPPAAARSR